MRCARKISRVLAFNFPIACSRRRSVSRDFEHRHLINHWVKRIAQPRLLIERPPPPPVAQKVGADAPEIGLRLLD